MILRRLLTITILLTSTIWSQAQQINAVPDYVFRNQMSVGRNAVTDTAAYFSIGPRYGATKGFMPPIVGDTATFSSGKRNGLLIFSVQKNKFLYWDSVRVQWSDMAGSSGAYIVAGDTAAMLAPYLRKADTTSMLTAYLRKGDTSSMLANYIRHAGYGLTKSGQSFLVDTLNIATRAWRQKGLDSLAALEVSGSGTTNYVPKFTAGSTIGNSQIFDNGTTIGIGSTAGTYYVEAKRNGTADIVANSSADNNSAVLSVFNSGGTSGNFAQLRAYGNTTASTLFGSSTNKMISLFSNGDALMTLGTISGTPLVFGTTNTERLRITSGGDVGIGTSSPSNARLVVSGSSAGTIGAIMSTDVSGTTSFLRMLGDVASQNLINWQDGTALRFATSNQNYSTFAERMRIFANGRVFVGASPTDAGYQLDVNGTLRSVNGANFATTSGNVGVGTASPSGKLDVQDALVSDYASIVRLRNSNAGTTNTNLAIEFWDRSTSINAAVIGTRSNISGNWGGDIVFKNQQNGSPQTTTTSLTEVMKLDGANQRISLSPAGTELFRFASSGEAYINTTSDAGDYKLQVAGNIYNTGSAVLAATSGNVGIGTASPAYKFHVLTSDATIAAFRNSGAANGQILIGNTAGDLSIRTLSTGDSYIFSDAGKYLDFGSNASFRMRLTSDGELLVSTTSDAGDYKLQVVGNARIGTGKLDIASNTTFGLGVARSGTSEVAGQIYNSNGILYLGAESSAGGQIFSGSSAYAAVIGSGANYPLQFATNNITRATMTTSGNLLLGFTTDSYFLKLQVNGSIFSNNQVLAQGVNAQIAADSSTNVSPLYISNQSLTGSSAQGLFYGSTTWNTTGNPSLIDLAITNTASGSDANYIKISDGSNIFRVTKAAEVVTAAPTGGSIRKWKLGEAATVSPTSPNRTIRVEIDGTVYYLHAKTTND